MNRVILIGNGFDLANGLKTTYKDFIDDFWEKKLQLVINDYNSKGFKPTPISSHGNNYSCEYEDEEIIMIIEYYRSLFYYTGEFNHLAGYEKFKSTISPLIRNPAINNLQFKNNFLEKITLKRQLQYWVDIEEEYYNALIDCQKSNGDIKKLNADFQCIQDALQTYLLGQNAINITIKDLFKDYFYSDFLKDDFIRFLPIDKIEKVDKVLFLNFNYTNIIRRYTHSTYKAKLINIHGELENNANKIIFGYGDEKDDNYKLIENMKNNDYLKYFKSFHYSLNNNYREMLKFINADEYQICIMGLSCGTSDRTLLHTLFEHKNCKSIKIFYYKENTEVDNYLDIYMNISRNFTDKEKMRELIVSKENSLPLPQGI